MLGKAIVCLKNLRPLKLTGTEDSISCVSREACTVKRAFYVGADRVIVTVMSQMSVEVIDATRFAFVYV